jgi:hypothetical protein
MNARPPKVFGRSATLEKDLDDVQRSNPVSAVCQGINALASELESTSHLPDAVVMYMAPCSVLKRPTTNAYQQHSASDTLLRANIVLLVETRHNNVNVILLV